MRNNSLSVRKLLWGACLASCLSFPLHAETLQETLAYAIKNHPSVLAAQQAEAAATQTVKEEKSAYYPTVNASLSAGRLYSDSTTTRGLSVSRGVGYSWYMEGNAQINQTLYDWNATDNSVEAAKMRAVSLSKTTENQEIYIQLQAVQSYLQLLRSSRLLNASRLNEADMQTMYDRIQTAFKNGGADQSEVSRAQDLLSLAKNAVFQYESEYQIAQASYKESVGRLPKDELQEPVVDLSVIPQNLADAIVYAKETNPQIRAFEIEAQANHYEYRREKNNMMPVFEAELSAMKKDQKDLVGGELADMRGLVRANWDYAFGGAQDAVRQRAAYQMRENEYNAEAMKRTVERDVEVSWASLKLAQQQKKNEEDRLYAAQKTLDIYQEQYKGGQLKLIDIMAAMNAAFMAKQDYLNAKYQEMNAAFTLKNVMNIPLLPGEGIDVSATEK